MMTGEAIAKQGVQVIHAPQTLSSQHVRAQNNIGKRPLLEPQAAFLEADEPAVVRLANDDVVQDRYVQQPASLHKLLRDVHIIRAGCRVSGWMVVYKAYRRAVGTHRFLEHLTGTDHC